MSCCRATSSWANHATLAIGPRSARVATSNKSPAPSSRVDQRFSALTAIAGPPARRAGHGSPDRSVRPAGCARSASQALPVAGAAARHRDQCRHARYGARGNRHGHRYRAPAGQPGEDAVLQQGRFTHMFEQRAKVGIFSNGVASIQRTVEQHQRRLCAVQQIHAAYPVFDLRAAASSERQRKQRHPRGRQIDMASTEIDHALQPGLRHLAVEPGSDRARQQGAAPFPPQLLDTDTALARVVQAGGHIGRIAPADISLAYQRARRIGGQPGRRCTAIATADVSMLAPLSDARLPMAKAVRLLLPTKTSGSPPPAPVAAPPGTPRAR